MPETEDIELLRRYADANSETAFTALVERHVNLVYSVALRNVGSAHAAQEISQAVFIILARKAGNFSRQTILSGWLYQTTRLTAANFLRGEIRRQNREQEAFMQSTLNDSESETWFQIAPILDDAISKLGARDRDAIVLRFFENKNLSEVGAALGASEDAAKMRVNRALEKLRKFFAKRGVTFSAAAIAGVVSANSIHAAPIGLTKTISAVAMAKGVMAGGSTLTLVKGTLKLMAWTKMKTAAAAGAVIFLAVGTTTVIVQHQHVRLPKPQPAISGQTEFPKASWHFAGYANPESTFESCMWAVNNDDVKTLLASVSPDARERLERGNQIITDKDKADYAKMTGYQILDKQVLSENEVTFETYAEGLDQTQKFSIQRIGGEWKFSGKAK